MFRIFERGSNYRESRGRGGGYHPLLPSNGFCPFDLLVLVVFNGRYVIKSKGKIKWYLTTS